MNKVRAMKDHVLVKRYVLPEMTEGGIHLPDQVRDRAKQGHVVDVRENEHGLEVGDEVFFGAFAGTDISIDAREDLLVLSITEILCTRKPAAAKRAKAPKRKQVVAAAQ